MPAKPNPKKTRRFDAGGGVDAPVIERDEYERRLKEQALQNVYPEELIPGAKLAGAAARAIGSGVGKAVDYFGRPAVRNVVVGPKSPYAYRNVSKRELDDIVESGFARRDPLPDAAKRTWSAKDKWWSAGDDVAPVGRNWNKGDATIRAKADKVPSRRSTRSNDLEVYDADTGAFVPLSKASKPSRLNPVKKVEFRAGGKVSASKRADGIAKKGKTRGRMI